MISPVSWSIEIATAADADEVAALHYLSHTKSFATFASPDWVASRRLANYQTQWRETLSKADPRDRSWVARSERKVVGMVRIMPMPDDGLAQLVSMHVHPDHQGQGIGTALMKVAEEFLQACGYRRAILGVIHANDKARRLYERAGWTVVEARPTGIEGVPFDIYGKKIGTAGPTA
jgi:ribosomal protein S18 acetylase RimI-like enzyme